MARRVIHVSDAPVQVGLPSSLADPIKPQLFVGKAEAQLAKAVGVTQFGVNLVTLQPGSISSLRHWHESEDEFIYVLSGALVLVDEAGEHALTPGAVVGFPAGEANGHHLVNRSDGPAAFLVVGTRKVGTETLHYPDDAIGTATVVRDAAGNRLPN